MYWEWPECARIYLRWKHLVAINLMAITAIVIGAAGSGFNGIRLKKIISTLCPLSNSVWFMVDKNKRKYWIMSKCFRFAATAATFNIIIWTIGQVNITTHCDLQLTAAREQKRDPEIASNYLSSINWLPADIIIPFNKSQRTPCTPAKIVRIDFLFARSDTFSYEPKKNNRKKQHQQHVHWLTLTFQRILNKYSCLSSFFLRASFSLLAFSFASRFSRRYFFLPKALFSLSSGTEKIYILHDTMGAM